MKTVDTSDVDSMKIEADRFIMEVERKLRCRDSSKKRRQTMNQGFDELKEFLITTNLPGGIPKVRKLKSLDSDP